MLTHGALLYKSIFWWLTWVGPEKAGNPHHLHGYVTKKIARRSLLDWLANHNTKLLEQ